VPKTTKDPCETVVSNYIYAYLVFELPGVGELNPPTVFPTPSYTVKLCPGGQQKYIHSIYITVLVGPPTVEKFNPQLIFHNSNTGPIFCKFVVESD